MLKTTCRKLKEKEDVNLGKLIRARFGVFYATAFGGALFCFLRSGSVILLSALVRARRGAPPSELSDTTSSLEPMTMAG